MRKTKSLLILIFLLTCLLMFSSTAENDNQTAWERTLYDALYDNGLTARDEKIAQIKYVESEVNSNIVHCLVTFENESYYITWDKKENNLSGVQFRTVMDNPSNVAQLNSMYATYMNLFNNKGTFYINRLEMTQKEMAQYLVEFYEIWKKNKISYSKDNNASGRTVDETSNAKEQPGEKAYQRALLNYDNQNDELALELFETASDRGHSEAKYYLGIMYMNGWGTDPDLEKAISYFIKSAQAGIPDGQLMAGYIYKDGLGTEKDTEAAIRWFSMAAEHKSTETLAKYELARIYYEGDGIQKDYHLAYALMEESANEGYLDAQYCYGIMLLYGGALAEAEEWLDKVRSNTEDPQVYYYLGLVYEEQERYDDAVESLEFAASSDVVEAMYYLGQMYYYGKNVPVDKAQASEWYLKAAKKGHDDSQFSLGLMLYKGDGIEKNEESGIRWINEAAKSGNEFAIGYLNALKNEEENN